jgi:Tfp pilus assembly protein PilF
MRWRTLVTFLTVLSGSSRMWGQAEVSFLITGDVRLEDGTPPQDTVQINRVCDGHSFAPANTDTTGHFTFSLDAGHRKTETADAGVAAAETSDVGKALNQTATQYTNPITTALRGCELRAVLAGFRSESVRLSVHDMSDDGRVGTIILHPLSRSGALTISATTAAAPATATKAVTIYPKFAIAWYQLGQVRQKRNAQAGALEAWKEARRQDPRYIKPYESLATVADRQGDWTAAEEYSRALLQLDPDDFAAAYLINAVANANLNRVDAAELAARDGLRVDKERKVPRLNYVLGLLLIHKQQYAESAKYLRAYLELAPNARDAAMVREQVAKLDRQAEAGPKQ